MGSPQLENLVRIRQLKEEAPARAEIEGLIRDAAARRGPLPVNAGEDRHRRNAD